MQDYRAPWWLPGGNLQTIWPALYARRTRGPLPQYRRERWTAPDGDFVDVDFLADDASRRSGFAQRTPTSAPTAGVASPTRLTESSQPLLVLFHGLEGSSRSHYAEAFADFAAANGMAYAVPHFRGCSGELNLGPRAYHSGDHDEIGWILQRLRERHAGPLLAVGVSLGGNALMRWAGEHEEDARRCVNAVAAVCSPLDLAAGGAAIGRGFNRVVYTTMFMRTMKPKALRKLAQHPGLFDREAMLAARDLYEFDNIFTAPLHGFRDTEDYWRRASAKPHLARIRVPALALNARNDPFVPASSLPRSGEVGSHVTLWQPAQGGHVGFPAGGWPTEVWAMPDAVGGWLLAHA
jgi:predicted alpha/beta-fold hydrolase